MNLRIIFFVITVSFLFLYGISQPQSAFALSFCPTNSSRDNQQVCGGRCGSSTCSSSEYCIWAAENLCVDTTTRNPCGVFTIGTSQFWGTCLWSTTDLTGRYNCNTSGELTGGQFGNEQSFPFGDAAYTCIRNTCGLDEKLCGGICIPQAADCCKTYWGNRDNAFYPAISRYCNAGSICQSQGGVISCLAVCSGTATLTLTPSTVAPGGSVIPSVATSSLTNCSGIISFKSGSCTGTQVSSCTIASGGCSGGAFTAPVTAGNHTYYACPPTGATSGSASLTVASPLIFGMSWKRMVRGGVFEDTDLDGIKDATETCPDLAATITATDTNTGVSIQYPFNTWSARIGGVPAGCNTYYLTLPSQKQHTIILSSLLNPSGVSVIDSYTIQPSTGFTVTLDSLTFANCRASPSPAACDADDGHVRASFALQVPEVVPAIAPWIQTTGGDVHSNTGINVPGGP